MPVKENRRRDKPHKVLHLTTYQRLEEYLGAFARGHFHLLILVGAGGLATIFTGTDVQTASLT